MHRHIPPRFWCIPRRAPRLRTRQKTLRSPFYSFQEARPGRRWSIGGSAWLATGIFTGNPHDLHGKNPWVSGDVPFKPIQWNIRRSWEYHEISKKNRHFTIFVAYFDDTMVDFWWNGLLNPTPVPEDLYLFPVPTWNSHGASPGSNVGTFCRVSSHFGKQTHGPCLRSGPGLATILASRRSPPLMSLIPSSPWYFDGFSHQTWRLNMV
jgi:hypothetical protein